VDSAPGLVVLTDTSVLINFLHLDRLDLLGKLPGYEFQVPDHVLEEIRDPVLRERMEEGLRSRFLSVLSITDLVEIESYARFHRTLGQGEAACLAVAVRRAAGWLPTIGELFAERQRKESARSGFSRHRI